MEFLGNKFLDGHNKPFTLFIEVELYDSSEKMQPLEKDQELVSLV